MKLEILGEVIENEDGTLSFDVDYDEEFEKEFERMFKKKLTDESLKYYIIKAIEEKMEKENKE